MKRLITRNSKESCISKLSGAEGYSFTRLSRTFSLTAPMSLRITASIFAPQGRRYGYSFEGTITEGRDSSVIDGKVKILKRTWFAHALFALAAIVAIALWFQISPPSTSQNLLIEIISYCLIASVFFISIFSRLWLFEKRVRKTISDILSSEWEEQK